MWPNNNIGNNLFQVSNPNFALEHFVANAAKFGIIIDQTKTLADFVIGFNAIAVALPTVSFIPAASQAFPAGEHFLVTGLRGHDGAEATLIETLWVAGVGDAMALNGNFTVNNNGTDALVSQPFTVFQKGADSPDAGWFHLSKPIMWKAQTKLTITGAFPTVIATANYNLRIECAGLKLI